MNTAPRPFPANFFPCMDESPDAEFFREQRLVTHIDDATRRRARAGAYLGLDELHS